MSVSALPWFVLSYLVGAIPTSLIVGKLLRKIDLREHGSRNLGATNVYRVLGWKYAIPVAIFDILKGTIPVLFFAPRVSPSLVTALLIGIAAIVGHVYSIFAGFKGGKGVATAAGAMFAIALGPALLSLAVFIITVVLARYVSLGSILAALLFPLFLRFFHAPLLIIGLSLPILFIILLRHAGNIRRLVAGTERKFGRKTEPSE